MSRRATRAVITPIARLAEDGQAVAPGMKHRLCARGRVYDPCVRGGNGSPLTRSAKMELRRTRTTMGLTLLLVSTTRTALLTASKKTNKAEERMLGQAGTILSQAWRPMIMINRPIMTAVKMETAAKAKSKNSRVNRGTGTVGRGAFLGGLGSD